MYYIYRENPELNYLYSDVPMEPNQTNLAIYDWIGEAESELSAYYFCVKMNKTIPLSELDRQMIDVLIKKEVRFYDNIEPITENVCTCGARHTSTPTKHLSYCDFLKN